MGNWLRALDNILRGETTHLSRLRAGRFDVPAFGLTLLIVLLGGFYGVCMGCFALLHPTSPEYEQVLASSIKVPALFLLTLLVTFPSLYVFNALVGSRLGVLTLLRLLISALSLSLAVLASFGPIVGFFSLTTTHYPFMVLLNVLVFALAGLLGLGFLLQTLHRFSLLDSDRPPVPSAIPAQLEKAPGGSEETFQVLAPEPDGPLERVEGSLVSRNVKVVFTCWLVVFALVGTQMSWVLRPFIGDPHQPFTWFRPRESNFFEAVARILMPLFS